MSNKCAFCGKENVNFTKEHIYPKCLYERTPEQNLTHIPLADKIIEAEVTIKDVCSSCNNGELSKLDNYFCSLFDTYVKNFVHRNDIINFEYDFDSLSRWLLKVSYNSARAAKTNYEYLSQFTDYMLYNVNRPDGLSLFIQLIIPYKMRKYTLDTFSRKSELKNGELLPAYTRAGEFELRRGNQKFRFGRVFAVNSYNFYIFIRPDNVSEKIWKKIIANVDSLIPGATRLRSFKKKVILKASNINSLGAYNDMMKIQMPAYLEWKEKQN